MTEELNEVENPITPLLSNRAYDRLKWLVQTALPLFGSLYFGLSQIWGLPASEEVVGTLALLATFFGAILGLSSKRYGASNAPYDGEIIISEGDEGNKLYTLSIDDDPENMIGKKSVTFKIMQ